MVGYPTGKIFFVDEPFLKKLLERFYVDEEYSHSILYVYTKENIWGQNFFKNIKTVKSTKPPPWKIIHYCNDEGLEWLNFEEFGKLMLVYQTLFVKILISLYQCTG